LKELVASAPARANLIGNPSDQYGGATLACTVPLRATVRLRPAASGRLVAGGRSVPVAGPADLVLRGDGFDLPRAVLAHLGLERPPLAIEIASEIPLQSGLAGSTALVVALLEALLAFGGRAIGRYALAELAREVERTTLGVQCGFVDQYLCVFGGLRYVDFRGKALDAPAAQAPFATVEPLDDVVPELPFLLAFTGVRHSSDSVHRPIRERWLAGEPEVVRAYARVAEIGLLGKKALVEGDLRALGALMNENHAIQRALGGSGAANEALVGAALAAGALGAKLAGAGQGGTVVALWPGADTAPLEKALRAAGASAFFRPRPCPGVGISAAAAG
jgi:galactokinase/mevalonate kinase-like predicted kinase